MPRHAFKLPREVVEAVRRHVINAIEAVTPGRFHQEANYTAALVNRLEGTAYQGPFGSVKFRATVFDDRGPKSAESRLGADFAIIATIADSDRTIEKVILVQAKLGIVEDLDQREVAFLREQIQKMKQLVYAPKVMEIPETNDRRFPRMVSGNNILNDAPYQPMSLENYFVARVTTTLDGCTDRRAVVLAENSSLTKLHVQARIRYVKA